MMLGSSRSKRAACSLSFVCSSGLKILMGACVCALALLLFFLFSGLMRKKSNRTMPRLRARAMSGVLCGLS